MVDFAQLRDAKPESWQHAADDWLKLAKEAEQSAHDIYANGTAALNEHWTDQVGQHAAQRLKDLANSFEIAAVEIRSVVSTLDGLADAAKLAQQSLYSAIDYARRSGMVVGADGQLTMSDPRAMHNDPGAQQLHSESQRLIAEAVAEANRIDQDAFAELDRLTGTVGQTDLGKAMNEDGAAASQTEVKLMADALPKGQDPAAVAAWWNGLTPLQQDEFARAVPVQLYDLNGIPQNVKDQLKGDYGYDRVELVRWAEKNWNNSDIDIFGNNCTQFVSTGLEHAGMEQKMSFWSGTLDPNGWGHGWQTGLDSVDGHNHSHTASWASANDNRNFMVNHGGETIPLNQARPGDILYLEQAGPGGPTDPGKVHHAAIVTSVTPDGDIHYTQHTDSRLNVSLNGRLPHNENEEGDQNIVIVRPHPNY
ncbi:amidase domain-containing protein [Actinocrispum wychmicini]|uniref:Putative amidase-like protein n=1 Tax=Actinocrispum wychmicini TaxID=1213861 RepID=A0A4R2J7P0_9PSEU|nr:amidase domain-containing protein [Actinocrispum wychmicini]TCO52626.1 putative amidase-like protein [Actinocrispum wychmicini]